MKIKKEPYGFELIMDLHNCNTSKFNKKSIENYFVKLCEAIEMKRCALHFFDDLDLPQEQRPSSPKTKGISAVQFILTSSVVIHSLDLLKAVYVNIFSCKSFDRKVAEKLTKDWFEAKSCHTHLIERV